MTKRTFYLIGASFVVAAGLFGARMLTSPLVSEATPPYAFCACADDILSSPRPIRTARLIAKKRPISLPPGGRFDPFEAYTKP